MRATYHIPRKCTGVASQQLYKLLQAYYIIINTRIYNACTFSSGTESEALAVTRWAVW